LNYENLKCSLANDEIIAVCPYADGELVTDSRIAALVPKGFDQKESSPDGMGMGIDAKRTMLGNLWSRTKLTRKPGVLLSSPMILTEDSVLFLRCFEGDGFKVMVNERYARVFDSSAEWYGTAPNAAVTIHENGEMVGVVMPMRASTNYIPATAVPSDEDLYYRKCPKCGGAGRLAVK